MPNEQQSTFYTVKFQVSCWTGRKAWRRQDVGFQKSLQRSNNRKALTMHLQTLAAYALEVSVLK